MRIVIFSITALALLAGCDKLQQQQEASFEIRDFSTKEETTKATEYSKEWNEFKSTGTVVAQGIPADRAVIAIFEYKDISDSPNPESQYTIALVRGGTGKVETSKSKYGEISKRPNYQWSVLGWHDMKPARVKVVN
ncbi:hypothetical protein ISN35_07125 [Xanthomonas translucens pv. undulosa]|uniref:hypothetical protein n=2 Tax=Xanthomonas campestris pv. translucens TaxID=343 RepID=UPI000AEB99BA|nr:hypothetical protein [Xanthomonas translucens]MBC3972173.1 hypothetical protein [Xanthomonas translucens pv. undulosa]QEO25072.1 hypothetical protein F0H32_01590 [Xanthomonas translucens pv. undulosa]QSQ41832.1 hypothetical protein ISN33_00690 [Xanthomonas translucens pv. translucens]QSQ50319.1 hypothetical protein ISN35_07125 [Xanthomonas translucens pv. undulosa]UNT98692.1 hypothetical protein KBQ49_17200 [Xanthomonas translucens pv. translucens]